MENLKLSDSDRDTLGLLSKEEVEAQAEKGRAPTLDEMVRYDIGVGTNVPSEYMKMVREIADECNVTLRAPDFVHVFQGFLHLLYHINMKEGQEASMKGALRQVVESYKEFKSLGN